MNNELYSGFHNMTGAPILANICLFMFYVFASYVPSILMSLIFTGKEDPNPKSGYCFSQADVFDFK